MICFFAFALCLAAQDAPPMQRPAPGYGGGQGPRGGRGGWGSGALMGTVSTVAGDHFILKTEDGQTFTIHFSANTRFLRQTARPQTGDNGRIGPGGTPPLAIKAGEIKVGDTISAIGETDAASKSVGAVAILQMSPEAVKQARELRESFGKTWLAGQVTAINGVTITLDSPVDHAAHTFTADENTSFRQRRDPITLGDLQIGAMVRVEGAVRDGSFVATTVSVREVSQGAPPMLPRSAPPAIPPR
jgi:hypothetical protein